jgi:hypothetical protein
MWARKLKGVRVQGTSAGDLKFTAVTYPQDHPFTVNDRTDSSGNLAGMRLKTYKMPMGKANYPPQEAAATPRKVEIVFIAKALFPHPPTVEDSDWIDMYLVREDRKDLLPEHMEAFLTLIMEQYAILKDVLHGGTPALSDDIILGKQALEVTWKKCKEEKGWASTLPSPYEMVNPTEESTLDHLLSLRD